MDEMHEKYGNQEVQLESQAEIDTLQQRINQLRDQIEVRWKENYDPSRPIPAQFSADPELGDWGEQVYQLSEELTEKQLSFQKEYGHWPTPAIPDDHKARLEAYRQAQIQLIALGAAQNSLSERLHNSYGNTTLSKEEQSQLAQTVGSLNEKIDDAKRTISTSAALLSRHNELNESLQEPHYIANRDDWK